MKRNLIVLMILGLAIPDSSNSQVLVNPDFEDTWNCPAAFDFETNIDSVMVGWFATSQTPDGWTETCTAMAPSNNAGIPPVFEGQGAAGLFTYNESFAQQLTQPLDPSCEYNFAFKAVGTHLGQQPPPNPPKCNYLCLYGTNTQPPSPGPFSTGTPADQLPGVTLLGCSENVWDTVWHAFDFDFMPNAAFEYIIVSMNPNPACSAVAYVLIDNIEIEKNCTVGVTQKPNSTVKVFGNNGRVTVESKTSIKAITVCDLMGRTLLDIENAKGDRFVSGPLHSAHVIVRIELEHGGSVVKRVMLQ